MDCLEAQTRMLTEAKAMLAKLDGPDLVDMDDDGLSISKGATRCAEREALVRHVARLEVSIGQLRAVAQ